MIIIIIIKIKRPNGEAPEISRRPKASQQGVRGVGAPPPNDEMMKATERAKRSKDFRWPKACQQGGLQESGSPPAQ